MYIVTEKIIKFIEKKKNQANEKLFVKFIKAYAHLSLGNYYGKNFV